MHLFTALIENYLTGNLRDKQFTNPPFLFGFAAYLSPQNPKTVSLRPYHNGLTLTH